MKNLHRNKKLLLSSLFALTIISLTPSLATADPESPMGYGMMGPGMMGGGYGQGMMGGYGMGHGMMGGYGHGAGMGPGMMMGGYGMGPLSQLNLTKEQQEKISRIQNDARKKNWDTMGKMMDEQYKLRELYSADKRDTQAISNQYNKVSELHRQIMENSLDTQSKIEALLTKEQKEKIRGYGPCWMMDCQ